MVGWYWVYGLSLWNYNYYVGMTSDIERRLGEHWAGEGSAHTRMHGVHHKIFAFQVPTLLVALLVENLVALFFIIIYGPTRARGGVFLFYGLNWVVRLVVLLWIGWLLIQWVWGKLTASF